LFEFTKMNLVTDEIFGTTIIDDTSLNIGLLRKPWLENKVDLLT